MVLVESPAVFPFQHHWSPRSNDFSFAYYPRQKNQSWHCSDCKVENYSYIKGRAFCTLCSFICWVISRYVFNTLSSELILFLHGSFHFPLLLGAYAFHISGSSNCMFCHQKFTALTFSFHSLRGMKLGIQTYSYSFIRHMLRKNVMLGISSKAYS